MVKKLKIVADENIPFIAEYFDQVADVNLISGRKIQKKNLMDADILLVRSVTKVNAELLAGTLVKFVGSATTGTDHIDRQWLSENNITFIDAKGANANAVAEYVLCCIAYLKQQNLLPQQNLKVGIVGVGKIGSLIAEKLQLLTIETLLNDPPRAASEKNFRSYSLEKMRDVDLLLLHTPLTFTGTHPTYHLINSTIMQQLKKGCVILNAGRGEVVDFSSFKKHAAHLLGCFDVWENEPYIDTEVLTTATIATPHIAGYTSEAKLQSAAILCQALQSYLHTQTLEPLTFPTVNLDLNSQPLAWEEVLLKVYNPNDDTQTLRKALTLTSTDEVAHYFDQLRKNYPKRHEFNSIILKNYNAIKDNDLTTLKKLGFKFQ